MSKIIINPSDMPIGNGGGTCKTLKDVQAFCKTSIPLIEIGSITVEKREGNTGNTFYPGISSTLNSIGMKNDGMLYYSGHLPAMIGYIHSKGKKAIINVAGFSAEEYALLVKIAALKGADYIVLNYGCPNVWGDTKEQKKIVSHDIEMLKHTTAQVLAQNAGFARTGRIGIKLSPLYPSDITIVAAFLNQLIERPIPHGGYIGFVTTMNTVPNCYDEKDGHSVISPGGGLAGMAGSGILPMALGQVRQLRKVLDERIDIIGAGGIHRGDDVVKMLNCGATYVQVVSAYYRNEDLGVFDTIGGEYFSLREKETVQ